MIQRGFLAAVVAAFLATPVGAQVKFTSTPILQSGVTNAGGPVTYPATDSAEVTALRVEIGPDGETGRHMHLYPAFVYVLEGAIEVEIEGSGRHSYKAGDSFLEAINTWHNGKNRGSTPVKLLVVFAGVRGKPNLVRTH
ncbi:MAG TPA: cupin domain-containing protein [Gemmatimonadales bacterium]|nr:cupin domain-containing protein [Gemmatimonadales bacterium]